MVGIGFRSKCRTSLPCPGSDDTFLPSRRLSGDLMGCAVNDDDKSAFLVITPKMPLKRGDYGDTAKINDDEEVNE